MDNRTPRERENDALFMRWLAVFGVFMVIVWIFFSLFIMPLMPHRWAGYMALIGLGVCLATLALWMVNRFEDKYPDENEGEQYDSHD